MSASYLKTLKHLYQVNKFSKIKLDLDNISRFAQLEGNPHLKIPFIHVAGTNGKGSVALKIAKILENSGLKTGLYTSPHLFSFRERIQINGALIEKDFIVKYLDKAFEKANENSIPMTYFEYVTMLCFGYFLQEKIDIGVLETGLGGRLDATNIVDPLVSVITSIGFDHCEILGDSLEEIAKEKAGIIKKKRPCVIGPFSLPREIFEAKCKEMESELLVVEGNSKLYDFNEENSNISRAAISLLRKYNKKYQELISQEAIEKGCQSQQLCRNQHLSKEIIASLPYEKKPKYIILDVGHNPDAIDKLFLNLSIQYPFLKKNVIYGTSSTKDCYHSLEILIKHCSRIHLIQGRHQRCMPIKTLSEQAEKIKNTIITQKPLFAEIEAAGNIEKTIQKVLSSINHSQDEEMIVICGSFFIMREVMDIFKIRYEEDPFELNEII